MYIHGKLVIFSVWIQWNIENDFIDQYNLLPIVYWSVALTTHYYSYSYGNTTFNAARNQLSTTIEMANLYSFNQFKHGNYRANYLNTEDIFIGCDLIAIDFSNWRQSYPINGTYFIERTRQIKCCARLNYNWDYVHVFAGMP